MQQAAQLSPSLLQQLSLSNAFMKSYRGTAPDDANIVAIQKELAARADVLGSLSKAYAALAALASYDAAGNFSTSIASLNTSLRNYATATKITPLPASAGPVTGVVGGIIINAIQQQQVRDAVDQLLPLVGQVISSFEANRQIYVDLDNSIADQASKATLELYNGGLFSITPILTSFGAPYGFTPVANADTLLHEPANQKYLKALQSAGRLQVAQQTSSVGAAFDASLSALKKLQTQHQALHDGKPVDLSLLLADVNYVQTITNQMIAALNTKTSTGK